MDDVRGTRNEREATHFRAACAGGGPWRSVTPCRLSGALDNELIQLVLVVAFIVAAVRLPAGLSHVPPAAREKTVSKAPASTPPASRATRAQSEADATAETPASPTTPIQPKRDRAPATRALVESAVKRPPPSSLGEPAAAQSAAAGSVKVAHDDSTRLAAELTSRELYLRAWQHYGRGIAHFKQGEYGAAVGEFTDTIRYKPDSAQSFHWRAMARIELGQFDAALDDMNRAISLRPRDPLALHARAVVFDRLGRLERARADVVEAIRISPANRACRDYLDRLDARIDSASIARAATHRTRSSVYRVPRLAKGDVDFGARLAEVGP